MDCRGICLRRAALVRGCPVTSRGLQSETVHFLAQPGGARQPLPLPIGVVRQFSTPTQLSPAQARRAQMECAPSAPSPPPSFQDPPWLAHALAQVPQLLAQTFSDRDPALWIACAPPRVSCILTPQAPLPAGLPQHVSARASGDGDLPRWCFVPRRAIAAMRPALLTPALCPRPMCHGPRLHEPSAPPVRDLQASTLLFSSPRRAAGLCFAACHRRRTSRNTFRSL
jgi:hypothetical protein